MPEVGTGEAEAESRMAAAIGAALQCEAEVLARGAAAAATVLARGPHPLSRGTVAAAIAASLALERIELPIAAAVAVLAAHRPDQADPAGPLPEVSSWSRAAMAREASGPVPLLRRC